MLKLIAPIILGAALLGGVLFLGRYALNQLKDHERYSAQFAHIQCEPPPNMTREELLLEVQYQSELPDQFNVLDPNLPTLLTKAFTNHAWVQKVERVIIHPTRIVQLQLKYREPVLIVPRSGRNRVVDREGTLLPSTALTLGLPTLQGNVPPPGGRTGTRWGNPQVEAAASVMGMLHPHRTRLTFASIEVNENQIVLKTRNGVTVMWGHAPGQEVEGEPTATQKLEQLLDYVKKHGNLNTLPAITKLDLRVPTK